MGELSSLPHVCTEPLNHQPPPTTTLSSASLLLSSTRSFGLCCLSLFCPFFSSSVRDSRLAYFAPVWPQAPPLSPGIFLRLRQRRSAHCLYRHSYPHTASKLENTSNIDGTAVDLSGLLLRTRTRCPRRGRMCFFPHLHTGPCPLSARRVECYHHIFSMETDQDQTESFTTMAFFTSNGGFEDRFKSPRSPRVSDPPLITTPSYLRDPFLSQSAARSSLYSPTSAINDSRNLQRRFTTSHYAANGQQRRSAFDFPTSDIFAVSCFCFYCLFLPTLRWRTQYISEGHKPGSCVILLLSWLFCLYRLR